MNRYERFVSDLGFKNPRIGRTSSSKEHLVGLTFSGFDLQIVRSILGKPKLHKPNLFFFKLAKSRAILVDTERNRILLANTKRAVAAFAKTVNS